MLNVLVGLYIKLIRHFFFIYPHSESKQNITTKQLFLPASGKLKQLVI